MMRLLSDDAARLTQGQPALADSEPELALLPARLTVTFGFGPRFVEISGADKPTWLRPLPAFLIDKLQEDLSHGDFLMQIACDDQITLAHATRMLLIDAHSFARIRWMQHGFRNSAGVQNPHTTMRNLFGKLDGSASPQPNLEEFNELVWADAGWVDGGTSIVVRRIEMNLDTWDELDRPGRE